MTIEVWSDVACPFCFLGKRRLEQAISEFPEGDKVQIKWRSYQLDPDLRTSEKLHLYDYLEQRGYDIDQIRRSNDRLEAMGTQAGIDFNFDKVVVANTFKAHILIHLAAQNGRAGEAHDRLLRAYFSDGLDVDDADWLMSIAPDFGVYGSTLEEAFRTGNMDEEVRMDVYEAHQLGATGVPFFVYNDKYIVRGAQEKAVFAGALAKSFSEWSL